MSESMRTVHAVLGKVVETCAYGDEHEVAYVAVKNLTPTGETRVHDNGYQRRETPLLVDTQGRVYHQQETIDYSNYISYVRDVDGQRFSPGVPYDPARDVTGKPLNGRTPPGPPWDPEAENVTRVGNRLVRKGRR